jgi:hypothetical protein
MVKANTTDFQSIWNKIRPRNLERDSSSFPAALLSVLNHPSYPQHFKSLQDEEAQEFIDTLDEVRFGISFSSNMTELP